MNKIVVFSGNALPQLAKAICRHLKTRLSAASITRFSNDCLGVQLVANCREADVFIIQPLVPQVQEHLMELLLMLDAARISIAARLVADLLATAGANRVLTMTLHAPQVHGFFSVPVGHMNALQVLAGHFR